MSGLKNNQNAMRHGLRASTLPKGCSYIDAQVRIFRTVVRGLLEDKHGELALYHEAVLQSAVRHEQRALLAARWLRNECESLDVDKRLSLLNTITNASDNRDKCLQRLGLDKTADIDPWDSLHNATIPQTAPESTESPQNAPQPEAATETPDTASTSPAATEKPTSDFTVAPIQTGE